MNERLLESINQIDTALARGLIGAGLTANAKRTLRAHCAHLRAGLTSRQDETTQLEAIQFCDDMARIFKPVGG